MKDAIAIILGILIVASISVGIWKFQKWANYKMSYSHYVEEQIKPLVLRIDNLEKRVRQLENK